MKNIGILSLLILFLFSSCRKDVNQIDITKTVDDPIIEQFVEPVEMINGDLIGFVVDENNDPVKDAMITLNDVQLTTDDYGHFFASNEAMNKLGTLVRVQKDGYFDGSRRFFPLANEKNRVKIQLLAKSFDYSFSTVDGGTVNFDNGAVVQFDPNSIKTANGDAYTGTVNVAAKWMDPSATETSQQMPGNLQGVNAQVEQVTLGTYGMIAVELQSNTGEPLNIADGETAQITMPVPASMLANAPSEIPLWSYNEEHGLWVEESSATLQNGNYVGDVSHFSFWNCDIPFEAIFLELTFADNLGNPLSNYHVLIEVANGGTGGSNTNSGSGMTDANGNVSGYVPAGEELIISVLDICGATLYTQSAGPLNTNTTLPTITVGASSTINTTSISGNLVDCDNNPVTNGVVLVTFQGLASYFYTTTSSFNFNFTSCSSTTDIEVIGINIDAQEQSLPIIADPNVANDLGEIQACDNAIENYISLTVDGITQIYFDVQESQTTGMPGSTYLFSQNASGSDFIGFGFSGQSPGDYSTSNFIEGIFSSVNNWSIFSSAGGGFDMFEVTQFDTKIVGTYSGTLYNQITETNVSVTGSFSVNL